MSQNRPTVPGIVTAVLVAHDGARWLPDTLEAVQNQTRPVDRFVAADNGSRDRGPALLQEALGAERIVTLLRDPDLAASMGTRGRAWAERDWSWGQVVARLRGLLRGPQE